MPPPASSCLRRAARLLFPALLPWTIFLIAGLTGVDFGQHWDESTHLQNVQHSLATEYFLPAGGYVEGNDPRLARGYYSYPSMIYWITMASAAPEILANLGDLTRPELGQFILSDHFLLRVRSVCVVISSLTILWVYLAVLRGGFSRGEAFLAASILAGSWEISYHSRWIATDTIVMQFGSLALLLAICALTSSAWKTWLRCAAIAAGAAAGTKYPGALVLIPVVISAFFCRPRRRILFAVELCVIAFATFLITTPGAILQAQTFLLWLKFDQYYYAQHGHWGYTVGSHAEHLWKMFIYESIILFSPQPMIAAALFAPAALGAFLYYKRSRKLAAVVVIFPILFIAYFSLQRVMTVRNILVVSPFVAILSARGFAGLIGAIHNRRLQFLAASPLTAAILFNWAFVLYAPYTVRQAGNSMTYDVVHLRDYMIAHPELNFDLSPEVSNLLAQLDPQFLPPRGPGRHVLVVCSWEDDARLQWPANLWNLTLETFGPYDVDFNYYPTWLRNRIVMLDADRAKNLPVDIVQRLLAAKAHR